jgi:adenylate cyclase
METYVGQDAASRVLEGHIRRGDLIDIEAAVCFCDLRDFTRLSQSLSQSDLLNLLDEAFEVVVNAVHEPGGDVLKFIGDAVLAVFRRAPDEPDLGPAVRRAAQAAVAIIARAEVVHTQREAAGKAPLRLGLSVHVGNVAYGNIGSSTRLDFTVIGATVNIASRLEAFCKTLRAPIVLSEAAAQYLQGTSEDQGMRLQAMGHYDVRGVDHPMALYAGFPITPSLT